MKIPITAKTLQIYIFALVRSDQHVVSIFSIYQNFLETEVSKVYIRGNGISHPLEGRCLNNVTKQIFCNVIRSNKAQKRKRDIITLFIFILLTSLSQYIKLSLVLRNKQNKYRCEIFINPISEQTFDIDPF